MHGITPLQEDTLNTGEMAVAAGWIAARRWYHKMNNHRYIPITLFSAWGRKLRILQVWHDKKEPRALHVRRSPIMDFEEGEEAKRADWITVLCWMMGQPVGEMVEDQAGETAQPVDDDAGESGKPMDEVGKKEKGKVKSDEAASLDPAHDHSKRGQTTKDQSGPKRRESRDSQSSVSDGNTSESTQSSSSDSDDSVSDIAEKLSGIVQNETAFCVGSPTGQI
jgi:hypothetical protein